jgi:AraC-like DNA-binding protein
VRCLWVHRVDPAAVPFAQPVLPDGCIDVVAIGDDVIVAGPTTYTTTVTVRPGSMTVGMRLHPGAAPPLVRLDASELRDRDVAVEDVWGRGGAELTERVAEGRGWRARMAMLVDDVTGRVDEDREPDPVALGAVEVLGGRPSRPLSRLADDVGLSERQLRRRVEAAVGYPPSTLARILRFQRFLDAARAAGPGRHLAALAADAGFADQAHLTRESNELTGLSPAALLRWEAQRMSESFKTPPPPSSTMGA